MVKYILVSGGVVSGVGKGLIASSVGVLLKSCGWNVTAVGLDPYLNVDAGVAARLIVPCLSLVWMPNCVRLLSQVGVNTAPVPSVP
jgi:hypothetical protein